MLYTNFHLRHFEASSWAVKTEQEGKTPYTKKKQTCTVWMCVHSTFACGDISGPLKMNRGKDFVEKFLQHAEGEVKQLYGTFPQRPMTGYWCVEKRTWSSRKTCFKGLITLGKEMKGSLPLHGFAMRISPNLNIGYQTTYPLFFTT